MKAFHIACGSSNLDHVIRAKGKKLVRYDICVHCARIIESDEIQRTALIVIHKVSFDDMINAEEDRKEVISKCFPGLIT